MGNSVFNFKTMLQRVEEGGDEAERERANALTNVNYKQTTPGSESRMRDLVLSRSWEELQREIPKETLLQASFGERDDTLLHLAVERSAPIVIVEMLLSKGLDVNSKNKDGCTPVHCAAEHGVSTEVWKMLLERGGDPNIMNSHGFTPLHWAAEHDLPTEVWKMLLERGGDPNIMDCNKSTTLHYAARRGVPAEVWNMLLERGGDLNIMDDIRGCTPLHLAAEQGVPTEVWKMLLERGGDLNIEGYGCGTPYHTEVSNKFVPIDRIILMLQYGANLETPPHVRDYMEERLGSVHAKSLLRLFDHVSCLLALASIKDVERIGTRSALRILPKEMLRLIANMLIPEIPTELFDEEGQLVID